MLVSDASTHAVQQVLLAQHSNKFENLVCKSQDQGLVQHSSVAESTRMHVRTDVHSQLHLHDQSG